MQRLQAYHGRRQEPDADFRGIDVVRLNIQDQSLWDRMLRGHSGRLEGALTTPKDAF